MTDLSDCNGLPLAEDRRQDDLPVFSLFLDQIDEKVHTGLSRSSIG